LLFILIGGSAVALPGRNTIFSNDIAKKEVRRTDLATNSVNSAKVVDDSLRDDDIDESSLAQVPFAENADHVDGRSAHDFVSKSTYRAESTVEAGTALGDGTHLLAHSCNAGDKMFSGGPANISATSTLLESFPSSTTTWSVRINKNGQADNFSVVVLCSEQLT
jgi:hypothetical protein